MMPCTGRKANAVLYVVREIYCILPFLCGDITSSERRKYLDRIGYKNSSVFMTKLKLRKRLRETPTLQKFSLVNFFCIKFIFSVSTLSRASKPHGAWNKMS